MICYIYLGGIILWFIIFPFQECWKRKIIGPDTFLLPCIFAFIWPLIILFPIAYLLNKWGSKFGTKILERLTD